MKHQLNKSQELSEKQRNLFACEDLNPLVHQLTSIKTPIDLIPTVKMSNAAAVYYFFLFQI